MRILSTFSVLALSTSILIGCASETDFDTTEEARAGINAANARFMAAVAEGDAAGVAANYTEDATFMAPNGETIVGRDAIQATMQAFIDSGVGGVVLESEEVVGMGDMAYEVGHGSLSTVDGQQIDELKYIVVWKRVDGQWYFHRDIFNSNLPVPEPASPETDQAAE